MLRGLLVGMIKLAVFSAALLLIAVLASTLWFGRVAGALSEADAILVLGAGMKPDGTLDQATSARVMAGVALYEQGLAPVLMTSGGPAVVGGPTAGAQMARLAAAAGVPESALKAEEHSTSTLQNALFSAPILKAGGHERVIVVTEGFHMARAITSLRWAGVSVSGAHVSTMFRTGSSVRMLVREAIAWPFNLGRVAAWHIGILRGVPVEQRVLWLR